MLLNDKCCCNVSDQNIGVIGWFSSPRLLVLVVLPMKVDLCLYYSIKKKVNFGD